MLNDIKMDLHVHTIASGHAYSTINEIVQEANKKGIEAIAIAEHGPNMPDSPHPFYFGNIYSIPREINGVKVFKGVEANIIDKEGNLDLGKEYLDNLEFVAAGLHPYTGYEGEKIEENTEAVTNAIKSSEIDMIVHPCDSRFPVNVRELVQAASENNVILELNNRSFIPTVDGNYRGIRENAIEMAELAQNKGVWVGLNSDTHHSSEVGELKNGLKVAKEAGLDKEDIINTELSNLRQFFEEKDRDLRQKF